MGGMSTSVNAELVGAGWRDVAAWLPSNIDELAAKTAGFRRRRGVRSASDLVRVALAYAVLDLSLRSVATWMATHRLGEVSDVAVLGRLRRGADFLGAVFASMLSRQLWAPPSREFPWRVRLVDATTVSAPGSDGADWRLHAGYDVARGVVDSVTITDGRGGEHLERIEPGPGEVLVGDRGYAHADRMLATLARKAHFVVRIGHSTVPLVSEGGQPLDPVAFARRKRSGPGRPPRVESAHVLLRDDRERAHPLRLVVVRKSAEATRRERERIRREASRKGKSPTAKTVAAAAYTFLLTSLPASDVDAVTVAELYRVRWQVELMFKRWKSLLAIDAIRARDPDLARAYLYAKLIAAVLADTVARASRAFSPWGVPLTADALADLGVGPGHALRGGGGPGALTPIDGA